jgi:hypothetical protein
LSLLLDLRRLRARRALRTAVPLLLNLRMGHNIAFAGSRSVFAAARHRSVFQQLPLNLPHERAELAIRHWSDRRGDSRGDLGRVRVRRFVSTTTGRNIQRNEPLREEDDGHRSLTRRAQRRIWPRRQKERRALGRRQHRQGTPAPTGGDVAASRSLTVLRNLVTAWRGQAGQ